MTIKLISLVILILFLLSGHRYSNEQFLFPKKKPSIFKNIENNEKIVQELRNFEARRFAVKLKVALEKDEDVGRLFFLTTTGFSCFVTEIFLVM